MKHKKIIYYKDELNDEFSHKVIKTKKIDENYRYLPKGKFWWRVGHFFWYRVIATPIAFLYCKIKFRTKFVNRKILKIVKSGYVLYGNHTQDIADVFIPSLVAYPKHVYGISHPNNVSMRVLGKVTPYMGALPLPDNFRATKNFIHAIETRLRQGHCLTIYPEAHIWPYYTSIRPFKSESFRYPIKYNVPAYCMTITYQARGKKSKPVITVYVDGPFYPDDNIDLSCREQNLRDKIYNTMRLRSKASVYEHIKYVREIDK